MTYLKEGDLEKDFAYQYDIKTQSLSISEVRRAVDIICRLKLEVARLNGVISVLTKPVPIIFDSDIGKPKP